MRTVDSAARTLIRLSADCPAPYLNRLQAAYDAQDWRALVAAADDYALPEDRWFTGDIRAVLVDAADAKTASILDDSMISATLDEARFAVELALDRLDRDQPQTAAAYLRFALTAWHDDSDDWDELEARAMDGDIDADEWDAIEADAMHGAVY